MNLGAPPALSLHRRFTVDEVNRMIAGGILGEDEPVELLGGELVVVSPQGPWHAALVAALDQRLAEAYRGRAHVRTQLPLEAPPDNLPEPDLAVVKGRPLDYRERHPSARDAELVVEIARTSQDVDRRKAAIYAAAGVAVYWLIDLGARRIEEHTTPSTDGIYERRRVLEPGEPIELPALDLRWSVADLVG